jgi:hypothetical protein
MKTLRLVSSLLTLLLLSGYSYSQETVHSGILHTTASGEENNLIKIHCDALQDPTIEGIIVAEYAKYGSKITSVHVDAANRKIFIKYSNAISANMLLGIMERVHFDAYYLDASGHPVRYTKTGSENFKR